MARSSQSTGLQQLTALARERQAALARFAWHCLKAAGARPSNEDVEDVLQDAYLVAGTKLRRHPDVEIRSMEAWFRRVLYMVSLSKAKALRKPDRRQSIEDLSMEFDALEMLAGGASPEALDSGLDVEALLAGLSAEDREILTMSVEGYTSAEIAERMGLNPAAVRQRRSRNLRMLRRRALGVKP